MTENEEKEKMKSKIEKKRNEAKEIIKNTKENLVKKLKGKEPLCDNITKLSSLEMIKQMKSGDLNPQDVLDAYMLKAINATEEFNCVTSVLPESFYQINKFRQTDKEDKMLYGLPVSLKECVGIKNHDCTIGFSKLIDRKVQEDSVIVRTLKHCGAIPFVRTNLPQSMCSLESSNPIYGETCNPHNKDFGPGGSSSGEGCLIGSGGSILGFGTDFAGSIRAPAHMCGICALKPTSKRLSLQGVTSCSPGQTLCAECIGPMARHVDTIVLSMKALLCNFMYKLDPTLPPLPFNNHIYEDKRKLRIGYYYTDNWTKPTPACQRATEMTVKSLETNGHTMIPFEVPDIANLLRLGTTTFTSVAGEYFKDMLKNDQIDKALEGLYKLLTLPISERKKLVENTSGTREKMQLQTFCVEPTTAMYCQLAMEINEYKTKFFNLWHGKEIDAIVCPSYPVVACPKGNFENFPALWSYLFLYNILDCPSGIVTVTKVSEEDVKNLDTYVGHYNDAWDGQIKTMSEKSLNMPVSVQCVGLPYQDEMCLRVMKEVETLCKQ